MLLAQRIKGSSETRHAAETEGKDPQRLFLPKREEPSNRRLPVTV